LEWLGRELGRWMSFRCGGLEFHDEKLADLASEHELLKLVNGGWRRKKKS